MPSVKERRCVSEMGMVQARDPPAELETDHVPNENEAANEIRMAQKHKPDEYR
jgi:hypothetical protein